MKRIFASVLCVLVSLLSFAQTQQGVVKTRGRMVDGEVVPGTRLAGATITLNFGNPLVSSDQGTFSFNVPATKSYSLVSATKQGYILADPEFTRRSFSYSADNPFYVVLEDENQRQADINAATRKVRRTLMAQLDEREEEIESLKAQNKLTEKEYQDRLKQLYDNQSKSEQLVREMAERYASTDYDQLDEFNRQVQMYIEEGELQNADSLIRSKGDIEKRVAEYHEVVAANNAEREKLEQSEKGATRTYEDLSRDLLNQSEIFLQKFQQDSALYCLKLRADLDTTNVDAVFDYAFLCQQQKKYTDSKSYFLICLKSYVKNNDVPNVACCQNNLGSLFRTLHDYANSEKFYKSALKNYEQLYSAYSDIYCADLAMIQYNLGNLYIDLHNYASSEVYLKLAKENYEHLLLENPDVYYASLARVQSCLGILYGYLHNYTNSEKYHKLALNNIEQLFLKNPDADRAVLAMMQNNLGNLYIDLHDYSSGEKYLISALKNYEQLFLKNPDAYRADLAGTQFNLGILYYELDNYINSEKYLMLALENREQLSRENPDANRSDLAATQNNIGVLYRDLHDYSSSERFYKLALENYEHLFRENPDAYRADLARTQHNMGVMYIAIQDYSKGEQYYQSALENYELLFRENPDEYCADLARARNNLGGLYEVINDLTNGKKYYKLALEIYERLFRENPDAYRADLAKTQNNLGILYYGLHDIASSEKYIKLAIENKEKMFKDNPEAYRKTLAEAYWNLMLLYGETNDIDQYDSYLENTMRLYDALYKLQPEVYSNDVIELQNRKVWRLLNNGKIDGAIQLAIATYTMDESNETSKAYLAECYNSNAYGHARESDYSNAQQSIDKAISLIPTNANFYDTKGEILLMQGKTNEALEMWKRVLELDPDFLDKYPDGTNLSNGLKKLGIMK